MSLDLGKDGEGFTKEGTLELSLEDLGHGAGLREGSK